MQIRRVLHEAGLNLQSHCRENPKYGPLSTAVGIIYSLNVYFYF